MTGLNRTTGRLVTGWPHVRQCLEVIFTTRFNERVMRRYVGSVIPDLLGQNLTDPVILQFYSAVAITIELWEPRFAIKKITPIGLSTANAQQGRLGFRIAGAYRPNALAGDLTEAAPVTMTMNGSTGAIS